MSLRKVFESRPDGSRYAPTLDLKFRMLEESPQELAFNRFREQYMLNAHFCVVFRATRAQLEEAKQAAYERMADSLYREQIGLVNLLQASLYAGDQEECFRLLGQLRDSMKW